MLGETVTVFMKTYGLIDEFGEPAESFVPVDVAGCLIRPLQGNELKEAYRPDGVCVQFAVALPKTFTAHLEFGALIGARIALSQRGMSKSNADEALLITGVPERTVPCPTCWDTIIECGRAYG